MAAPLSGGPRGAPRRYIEKEWVTFGVVNREAAEEGERHEIHPLSGRIVFDDPSARLAGDGPPVADGSFLFEELADGYLLQNGPVKPG